MQTNIQVGSSYLDLRSCRLINSALMPANTLDSNEKDNDITISDFSFIDRCQPTWSTA